MVQFSTENSGVAVINPIRKIESVDMIDLRIWQIYNKFLQKFQVFYFNSKVGVWSVVILAAPSSWSAQTRQHGSGRGIHLHLQDCHRYL